MSLLVLVHRNSFIQGSSNKRIWLGTSFGGFPCKSYFQLLVHFPTSSIVDVQLCRNILKEGPSKVSFLHAKIFSEFGKYPYRPFD